MGMSVVIKRGEGTVIGTMWGVIACLIVVFIHVLLWLICRQYEKILNDVD